MNDGVRMQKEMAMGGDMPSGDFGVEKLDSHCKGSHPDHGTNVHNKHLGDHERGAVHPIHHTGGHMPAQANPDHGPHHHRKK